MVDSGRSTLLMLAHKPPPRTRAQRLVFSPCLPLTVDQSPTSCYANGATSATISAASSDDIRV